ncbi:MAG: Tm-1-like ATP-binding domain-containing protein [Deltaproteobacteria bacterium]|nr:Tm-1-like ATP-binding domain-containing protein [Deltaproteobacteria bacterium]
MPGNREEGGSMSSTVLIIGTLDTKARELNYLKGRVEATGAQALLMDVSCRSKPIQGKPDISCEEVALEGGESFQHIATLDKNSAVQIMARGAASIAGMMVAEEKINGVIGLGGANGAEIACAAMRSLPVGFPKIMVTCVASGNVRPYVGTKDIIMANSIGDISLNSITKSVIHNAAAAIAAMASAEPFREQEKKDQICISSFGTTLRCVEKAKDLLEKKGFEVVELHASGAGGVALEELVRSGQVSGALDITTSELVDDLVGGMYSAGPNRLEAAAAMGVPQVVSVGALDFANFGSRDSIPQKYHDREFYFYTPSITLMRTNVEENQVLGERIAKKLNRSAGPCAIIIPRKGFSALDVAGGKKKTDIEGKITGEWHDQEANSALIDSLKANVDASKVKLVEIDAHINDPEFAGVAVDLLTELMWKGQPGFKKNKPG